MNANTEYEMYKKDAERIALENRRKELIQFMDWVKKSPFSATSSTSENLVDIYLGIHEPSVKKKPDSDEMSLKK